MYNKYVGPGAVPGVSTIEMMCDHFYFGDEIGLTATQRHLLLRSVPPFGMFNTNANRNGFVMAAPANDNTSRVEVAIAA